MFVWHETKQYQRWKLCSIKQFYPVVRKPPNRENHSYQSNNSFCASHNHKMYTAVERLGSKINLKTSEKKFAAGQIRKDLFKPEPCSQSKMRLPGHLSEHDSNSFFRKLNTDPTHIERRLQNVIWRGWWNRTKINLKSEDLVRTLSTKEQKLNDNTLLQKLAGANIFDITEMIALRVNSKELPDTVNDAKEPEIRKTSGSTFGTKAVGPSVVESNIVEANNVLAKDAGPNTIEENVIKETTTEEYLPRQDGIQPTLIYGNEVSDGFARYFVPSLQLHEFPVVGTFVDKHVSPGFTYRVRRNGTDEYFFEGKALILESVGQGYGKRLTFESEDLLENDNYFWSDSYEDGFAFSIQAVSVGDEFEVFGCKSEQIASATIKDAFSEQVIESTEIERNGIVKNVQVKFNCAVSFRNNDEVPCELQGTTKEFLLCGRATVIKKLGEYRAKTTAIKEVELDDIGVCTMLIEGL